MTNKFTNDEIMQLKSAIGNALVYLRRYRDRREDDMYIHGSVAVGKAAAARAKDDVMSLDALIEVLGKSQ